MFPTALQVEFLRGCVERANISAAETMHDMFIQPVIINLGDACVRLFAYVPDEIIGCSAVCTEYDKLTSQEITSVD